MSKKRQESKWLVTGILLSCALLAAVWFAIRWTQENKEENQSYRLICIPKTTDESNGFWTSLIDGAKLGAQEYGAEIEVVGGLTEDDLERQIQVIEESIAKKPDAMLVAPCDYARMSEALQKVVDADIKLILIDSVIDRDIADGMVSTNNYLAGRELGNYARRLLDEDSKIGIVGHVKGTSTAIERENGIRYGLGTYNKQVVDVVFCDSDYDRSYALTTNMLHAYPEINLIVGTNEYAAVGAARAIKDLGLAGQVQIVGFDSSVEEIQLLEEGVFQGIIIQKPFNMGYLGVGQAVDLLKGKEIIKNLDSGCKMIDKENLYEEENQRLLYPFTG